MIEFKGILYRSGSSHAFDAVAQISERGAVTLVVDEDSKKYAKGEYEVEPRLGKANRIIRFSDGVRFETGEHEAFASFEGVFVASGMLRFVDWMESRWLVALGSIVGIAVFVFLFFEYGMPMGAKYVAFEVPQSVRQTLSENGLKTIERYGSFEESYSMRMHRLGEAAFDRALGLVSDSLNPEFDYELRIYESPTIGPNAFALPSGLIVATEAFIELCETEEQMVAVFLHEIAHVELQHGLRSLIQDTGVFLMLSMILGDFSSLGGMAASLPALAIESRYSQNFETEADLYAGKILEAHGIGAEAMKEILILLHSDVPDLDLVQFLASHPDLEERLRALDSLAEEN
ncbi:MAG TPA: hypothetical protein DIV79_04155 [Opitutae bacterium]|nr:hypothetical protein [Opitutaceae bacterium]HCR29192.1 hypothetical protein [Opitutae bacterium]